MLYSWAVIGAIARLKALWHPLVVDFETFLVFSIGWTLKLGMGVSISALMIGWGWVIWAVPSLESLGWFLTTSPIFMGVMWV